MRRVEAMGLVQREALEDVASRLRLLEPLEPRVDAAPARADEVDEEREVVDACVPLGEEVALEALEPADRLVQEPADLGDVSRDGEHLGAKAVADGGSRPAPGSTPRARQRSTASASI